MLKSSLLVLIVLALAVPQSATATEDLPAVAPVTACADLAQMSFSLPEAPTIITAADEQSVNGHDMCVIKGTISPRVSFEVHLPVTGWTQRYLQTGCGGLCGRLGIDSPQRDCTPEVDGAMAMASTDMGHDTDGGTWGASDMQLRVDFGYRGVHVTDLTLLIAARLAQMNPVATFIYVSGAGTDETEAGNSMWARVKGRTENDLQALPFGAVHLFRPAAILPVHGETSKTAAYRIFYSAFGWLLRPLRWVSGGYILTTEEVGQAMLRVTRCGWSSAILDAPQIRKAARVQHN